MAPWLHGRKHDWPCQKRAILATGARAEGLTKEVDEANLLIVYRDPLELETVVIDQVPGVIEAREGKVHLFVTDIGIQALVHQI